MVFEAFKRKHEEEDGRWVCRQGHRHKAKRDKSWCNKKHWKALSKEEQRHWVQDTRKKVKARESELRPPKDDDEPFSEDELSPEEIMKEREIELLGLIGSLERALRKERLKVIRQGQEIGRLEEELREYEESTEDGGTE